jgi:hypothetical protein
MVLEVKVEEDNDWAERDRVLFGSGSEMDKSDLKKAPPDCLYIITQLEPIHFFFEQKERKKQLE